MLASNNPFALADNKIDSQVNFLTVNLVCENIWLFCASCNKRTETYAAKISQQPLPPVSKDSQCSRGTLILKMRSL